MSFTYERRYRGTIQAVLLDWAGTTMDYGCMAPAVVFVEVFKRQGVPITMDEARAPMGAHKRVHIKRITQLEPVALPHLVLGRPAWVPLGPAANKTGRVAGTVAAGGTASFQGVVGTAVVKVFDLEVARTGLGLAEAQAAGLDAVATDEVSRSRAKYYPGGSPLHVRLVHTRQGRLLGGQLAGREGAAAARASTPSWPAMGIRCRRTGSPTARRTATGRSSRCAPRSRTPAPRPETSTTSTRTALRRR